MAALLAVFAEFEREVLRERVRAGLAHARQNGKRLGRPLTAALHAGQVRKLFRRGISKSEIARRPHIGRTSVRRVLADSDIYQIKVALLGTKPPVWRRLLIPADVTLAQLHNVLQIAMGWEDGHMHEFRVAQRRFGQPEPADPFMRMPRTESERTARLSAVLGRSGTKMI